MTLEGQGIALQVMGEFNGGFMRSVRSGAEKSSFPTHVADDCGEDWVEVRSTSKSR